MIQSYPWYIADWRESETRIRLSLPERALYRELLDYCYLEGSLPTDPVQLSRIAGCTTGEIKRYLPEVEPLFYRKDGRMFHAKVDAVRLKLEAYHEQKRHAGSASGRTRRERAFERSANERSTDDGTKREPSPTPAPSPSPAPAPAQEPTSTTPRLASSEYPQFTQAVVSEFPGTDDALLYRILHGCTHAYAGVTDPRVPLNDALLADAVRSARAQTPKQYNAVLYESTLPKVVKSWAVHGRNGKKASALPSRLHEKPDPLTDKQIQAMLAEDDPAIQEIARQALAERARTK